MSLDIYLFAEKQTCVCGGTCPLHEARSKSHSQNITHNLGLMAEEAGIFKALWQPEDCGVKTAGNLARHLFPAINHMKGNPEHYKKFDAPNGWGTYDDFVPWLEELLTACNGNPFAEVSVSR